MEQRSFKTFVKPASLLFYLLTVLNFFFLGMIIAGLLGAGKNQGLAAGAIVLGYGVMAAFFAWLAALLIVAYGSSRLVVMFNKIWAVLFVLIVIFLIYRVQTRHDEQSRRVSLFEERAVVPIKATQPVRQSEQRPETGLGMATPDFFNKNVLYFYNRPNFDKALNEHLPSDSLVFKRAETGIGISYAPPWFVPAHLKMDYQVLHLRALSVYNDFVEVVVNESSGQTTFVSRYDIALRYWPEFLLSVNSVEPFDRPGNPVRVKPLSHASPLKASYAFLKPLRISRHWLYVELLDEAFRPQGRGWIRWQDEGGLLIRYNLFS